MKERSFCLNVQLLKVSVLYSSGTLQEFSGIPREEAFTGASSYRFIFTERGTAETPAILFANMLAFFYKEAKSQTNRTGLKEQRPLSSQGSHTLFLFTEGLLQ